MQDEYGGSDDDACHSYREAEQKEGALAGEERDGAEDHGYLEEGFAEVVASGFGFGAGNLGFEFAGSVLLFGQVGLPFGDVCLVLVAPGADGGGVCRGHRVEEVECDGEIVHADLLGLVFIPLIARTRLHENGFGVAAVAEDGDHGYENSENRDAERDAFEGLSAAFMLAGFLHLIGKFLYFIGFHNEMILARFAGAGATA